MDKRDNTIVTIGDIHYLWGLFLLAASIRKAGMEEPLLIGVKDFTPEAEKCLAQLGNVTLVSLDGARRSLACLKPQVMLQAKTPFVTWADSDAFFTGDVSGLLPPVHPDEIHFRLRTPPEMAGLSDVAKPTPEMMEAWRQDIAAVAGTALDRARYTATGSSCFCALSLERHRRFLEVWEALVRRVLPERNVGVVDKSLRFYPQLDESTLNACLFFLPEAPRVQETFRMDKERERLFVHFIAHPKPWEGWTRRAFRFFDEYVSVVEWAASQGFALPGPVPACLQASHKGRMRLMIPWMTLKPKLGRRLKRLFGG